MLDTINNILDDTEIFLLPNFPLSKKIGNIKADLNFTLSEESYHRLILELTLPEYAAVRTVYHQSVRDQVEGYLTSGNAITKHKSDMNEAILVAYTAVAGIAWHDGGGDIEIHRPVFQISGGA